MRNLFRRRVEERDAEGAPEPTSGLNGAAPAVPACIFCGGPCAGPQHAWPGWLADLVIAVQRERVRQRRNAGDDALLLERARQELDRTVADVCRACSSGWMQRLDDSVEDLLESMVHGARTVLPASRRDALVRWAAKTAMVIDAADSTAALTPSFARDWLRHGRVHPGTQVLVGRYDGRAQLLTCRRDVFTRLVDGEPRDCSQSTFVIGSLLLQVFADPWRDTTPEPDAGAGLPLVALVGNGAPQVVWPPGPAVDDADYDVARRGTDADRPPTAPRAAPPSDREPRAAPAAAGAKLPVLDAVDRHENAGEQPAAIAPPGPRSRWGAAAVVGVVLVAASLAFGFVEHSRANTARSSARTARTRAAAFETRLKSNDRQLRAAQAAALRLRAVPTGATGGPQPLPQIEAALPGVTSGLRACSSAALAAASAALDLASALPHSSTNAVANASNSVVAACERATAQANELDQLIAPK